MSDTSTQRLKVSREGIVLIKSFEGFRPRAIRREEGGWIIGYGHTLSAREGATVSEADAELLLRYDLLPVEKSLNETVPPGLNQHQFDALVSFAFSVGVDRFIGSDVSQRLAAGAPAEAAEAMMGWPEPVLPQTALRRRVAERALFTADPAVPVALADLLAAPLPLPPMASVPAHTAAVEPVEEAPENTPAKNPLPMDPAEADAPADPRGAAVAALLGEAPGANEPGDALIVPSFVAPLVPNAATPRDEPAFTSNADPVDTNAPAAEIWTDHPAEPATETQASSAEQSADAAAEPTLHDPRVMAAARYAPYSAMMVGPLPYLQPAAPRLSDPEATPEPELQPEPGMEAEASEGIITTAPAIDTLDVVIEAEPAPMPPTEGAGIAVISESQVSPAPVAELVLTPSEDAPEPALVRALWTPEERAEPSPTPEAGLFGEDLSLTQAGGPILRHEYEPEAPVRFDWSETGAFIIMGAVGLTAFGASMAAFRLASEQSNGGSDTTIIAWVLAVIGTACVGVSSFNLYRRWGLPGGD